MSKNYFENLGKKLDVFVEKYEKDMEGFKTKAEAFAKEAEAYVESLAKNLEPVINDLNNKFEQNISEEKTIIFNIKGEGKYKLKYSGKESTLTITKKGSERVFTLRLDKDIVTKKKIKKVIDSAVVNKEENTLTLRIKRVFLSK